MKQTFYIFAAGIFALMASCKKEAQQVPVNTNDGDSQNCSFCFGDYLQLKDSGTVDASLDSNAYLYRTDFFDYDGPMNSFNYFEKSLSGIYGGEGLSIVLTTDNVPLLCTANKISFSHARAVSNTNANPSLINVKLPGTPLIVTTPDSLNFYLSPYGYAAQSFSQPGTVYRSGGQVAFASAVVDSIIITGPGIHTATIGVNLFESELRNICISHQ